MRILPVVALGLIVACVLPAAALAGPELYFLGGGALTNLGTDADQFGSDVADVLSGELGGDWSSTKGSKTGFDLGMGFVYSRPASPVGFGGELRFVSRGTKWDFTDASATYPPATSKLKLTYVEIPVLLQITPGLETAAVRPTIVAGPVFGILASSKFTAEGGGGSSSADFSDFNKSTYVGATIGAGVRIRAGARAAVLVQARALFGLTNILADNMAPYSMKSQDFSLLVGYSFGL